MKQLLLFFIVGILSFSSLSARSPKSGIRPQIPTENISFEQLEQEYQAFKRRGVLFLAGSTIPLAISAGSGVMAVSLFAVWALTLGHFVRPLCFAIGFTVLAVAALTGGIYMIAEGIHNLAKAKKLRRLQMKEAAEKRRIEREIALSLS